MFVESRLVYVFLSSFLGTICFVHTHECDFEIVMRHKNIGGGYLSFEWHVMREKQLARDVTFEHLLLQTCAYEYVFMCTFSMLSYEMKNYVKKDTSFRYHALIT